MDIEEIITQLEKNMLVFKGLLNDVPEDLYRWRPAPEKWNLLDVVCHLRDEEIEDFRTRVRLVLEEPETPLPPFNPEAWVVERKYAEKDYSNTLKDFLNERQQTIAWLRSLKEPNWNNSNYHPEAGSRSARFFLENWLGHDLLHIRQILGLKFQYANSLSENGLDYAGKW